MWCKWCGDSIPEVVDGKRSTQRLWHPACADAFNLHTNPARQREFVVDRDGEKCAVCGEAPTRWLPRRVTQITRRNVWIGARGEEWARVYWDGPTALWSDMSREERRLWGAHQEITRVSALELDHRIPLWSVADLPDEERRWYFGPGNLWLLCPSHHKDKTKREAAERAAIRAFDKAQARLPL